MARFRGIISLDIPEGATREDMASYIIESVATMKGSKRPACADGHDDPGDPLFYLDGDSIELTCRVDNETIRYINK